VTWQRLRTADSTSQASSTQGCPSRTVSGGSTERGGPCWAARWTARSKRSRSDQTAASMPPGLSRRWEAPRPATPPGGTARPGTRAAMASPAELSTHSARPPTVWSSSVATSPGPAGTSPRSWQQFGCSIPLRRHRPRRALASAWPSAPTRRTALRGPTSRLRQLLGFDVFDALGRRVGRAEAPAGEHVSVSLPTEHLAPGVPSTSRRAYTSSASSPGTVCRRCASSWHGECHGMPRRPQPFPRHARRPGHRALTRRDLLPASVCGRRIRNGRGLSATRGPAFLPLTACRGRPRRHDSCAPGRCRAAGATAPRVRPSDPHCLSSLLL
jgi:hypothetical protein